MKLKTIGLCIAISACAWGVRILLSGSPHFAFLVPNVVLASVPLLIEPLFGTIRARLHGVLGHAVTLLTAGVWLLFLPNAFYILTDFMHLNEAVLVNEPSDRHTATVNYIRGDGLYVYDSFLIFLVTLFGAYVGGLALLHAYAYFKKKLSPPAAIGAIGLLMILASIGVYIGRFGRWNSWEGLIRPQQIVRDLWDTLQTTQVLQRFVLVIITVLIFQVGSMLVLRYLRAHER